MYEPDEAAQAVGVEVDPPIRHELMKAHCERGHFLAGVIHETEGGATWPSNGPSPTRSDQ